MVDPRPFLKRADKAAFLPFFNGLSIGRGSEIGIILHRTDLPFQHPPGPGIESRKKTLHLFVFENRAIIPVVIQVIGLIEQEIKIRLPRGMVNPGRKIVLFPEGHIDRSVEIGPGKIP